LNQWPRRQQVTTGITELLPAGLWADLAEPGGMTVGPVWVALEDDYGNGAAVAVAGRTADDRIEVDAWTCPEGWDSAIREMQVLGLHRRIRQLLVGATMRDSVPQGTVPMPQAAAGAETRVGLALFRDLAAAGALVHDETTEELDKALLMAQVRESVTGGLQLVPRGPTHLIRALVWAVNAAHRPTPVPAVH